MTCTLRHHSPIGPLQIAGVVGIIEPDTDFEVPDVIAELLLEQHELYELIDGSEQFYENKKINELRTLLSNAGLSAVGHKDELVARLEQHELEQASAEIAATPQVITEGKPTTTTAPAASGSTDDEGDSK